MTQRIYIGSIPTHIDVVNGRQFNRRAAIKYLKNPNDAGSLQQGIMLHIKDEIPHSMSLGEIRKAIFSPGERNDA